MRDAHPAAGWIGTALNSGDPDIANDCAGIEFGRASLKTSMQAASTVLRAIFPPHLHDCRQQPGKRRAQT
jgi:hypothetical protein